MKLNPDAQSVLDRLQALLAGRGFLQARGLIDRLAREARLDPVAVKLAMATLARCGVLDGVTDRGEVTGRVSLLIPVAQPVELSSAIHWREALQALNLAEDDIAALLPCHAKVDDWTSVDLRTLAQGLLALRAAQVQGAGTPRFVVSARYLMGSSKLLNSLPPQALRTFGIRLDLFPDAVPYVVVAGPAEPEVVLLIENPHAFEEAIAAGVAQTCGLMVTFGYGLTRAGDAYGNQLAVLLGMMDQLVPLVRSGNPPQPAQLLAHPRLLFWGDLDREGLRIYASLRQRFPKLRLSALYRPMIDAARQGASHPYVRAAAKDSQGDLGDLPADAQTLAPWCRDRAVDQELVCRGDILTHITEALDEA